MEEINRTSHMHDEYGAKAGGILAQLHTFDTYFGFKLSHLVFSATEQLSCFLQTKDVSLQEALRPAAVAVRFFERNRSDEAFCYFYKQVVEESKNFTEPPTLPRIRRPPRRYDSDSDPLKHLTTIIGRCILKSLIS